MNKINLILTILVFFTAQSLAQKIEYSLTFAKDTFLVCEGIVGLLTMRNENSDNFIEVVGEVTFKLKNENNETMPNGHFTHSNESNIEKTLNPKDEFRSCINVLGLYGKIYSKNWFILHIPEGKYYFEVIFLDVKKNEIKVVDSFWVKNPTEDESIVLNSLLSLLDRGYTSEEFIRITNSIFNNFPNSVYAGIVLELLASEYEIILNDPRKAAEVYKILVQDYPTNFTSMQIIKDRLGNLENSTERAEIINKIKMKVKGTIFEKFYDQELKEIEEN